MNFYCARQAWHDAYLPDVRGQNAEDQILHFNVEFTSKGADGKIIHDCERAIIQRAVQQVKDSDPVAYAWGMFAYTDGIPNGRERGALLGYLMAEYNQWTGNERRADRPHQDKVRMLARLVMHAEAKRDLGQECRTDMSLPRKIVGCENNIERWNKEWKPVWRKLNAWLEPLPGRALPAVAQAASDYRDKLKAA